MNRVVGMDSRALQAGGHRFDPGHVHHFFLIARDLLESSLPQSLIFFFHCARTVQNRADLSRCTIIGSSKSLKKRSTFDIGIVGD
jgi:hypothetical protein